MKLILSTRGSQLALWQAHMTRDLLLAQHPRAEVEIRTVKSSGDRDQKSDLARFGSIGIFTVEVDRALLDSSAHIGVHSLKDMTTVLQEGIVLAGVSTRGPVEDVLISRSGAPLADLPQGARVATGSLRRAAMLLATRPDLEVVQIRGNVETRLAKLERGDAEALVMARAGIMRLGLEEHICEVLDTTRFLPAVGQGIVGWTVRADDEENRARMAQLADPAAFPAALAERALLRKLQGGCNAPIGAHATVADGRLELRARVLSPNGVECVEGQSDGAASDAAMIGEELASTLLGQGAGRIVEEART